MPHTSVSSINSYDAVPYRGEPYRQTHPALLSALAHLFSLPAASPEKCRVLELGCCDGGNLIAMAVALPGSTFVGVDYSAAQIASGQQTINHLGLKNVELRAQSILDITPEWGAFDYILCHGVFSWVPVEVQEKILEVSSRNLSAQGIAYISYNTQPGWHLRGIVRDLMRYHAKRFDDPARQIQEARHILDFVAENAASNHVYTMILKAEAEVMRRVPDHYLYHEHLEDHSEPFYFHEFVDRAGRHGLSYLSESSLASMSLVNFGPTAEKALAAMSNNLVELEQFMDFLGNRTFRETLLRHTSQPAAAYSINPIRLRGLYLTGTLRSLSDQVDLQPDVSAGFESHNKFQISTKSPLLKSALCCLINAFPDSMLFETLVEKSCEKLKAGNMDDDPQRTEFQLGAAILQLLTTSELLAVSSIPACFTTTPGTRPMASPLARLQAQTSGKVTTLRHDTVTLDPEELTVLKQLDGSKSISELAAALEAPDAQMSQMISKLAKCALIQNTA